jgi:hypothetical protein
MATTEVTKTFLPDTVGTEDNWNLKSGPDKVAAVNPGFPLTHDDLGTRIKNADLSTDKQSYKINREFPDSMGTVNEVRVHYRALPNINNASIKVSVALTAGPTWVSSPTIDLGTGGWVTGSAALARPGGGSWTEDDFRDTTFQFSVEPDSAAVPDIIDVTSLWVEVDYLPTDESEGAIPPEFPARKLRRSRVPLGVMEAELRADALDIDLLEDFEVTHSQGPHPSGTGWKDTTLERRHFRMVKSDLDLNTMKVRARAIDLTDYTCMFWHTGISPYTYRSDEQYPDGPANLHPGSNETFTRGSNAWIQDASNKIVQVSTNKKRIGPNGVVLEEAAENGITNSSFFNGWTEWTRSNTAISTLDTSETLFVDSVATGYGGTNQSAKLTYDLAAVPPSGRSCVVQTSTHVFGGGTNIVLSIWHKDSTTDYPPKYKIRRGPAGASCGWYDASDDSWNTTTPVLNSLNTYTTGFGQDQVTFQPSQAGKLEFTLVSPESLSTEKPFTYFAHVQAEQGDDISAAGLSIASTPIPTFDSTITRAAENWNWTSDPGRRVWPPEAGTALMRVAFLHNATDLPAEVSPANNNGIPLLAMHFDTRTAIVHIRDDRVPGFRVMTSTLTTSTYASSALEYVKNDPHDVAVRWTSTQGELGLPSRTLSIFIDGVKGTDVQQNAPMVDTTASSILKIGSSLGLGTLREVAYPNAAFSHIEILPWALSCGEINARP